VRASGSALLNTINWQVINLCQSNIRNAINTHQLLQLRKCVRLLF